MSRLFGTDGVRGVANSVLTPELAFKLGRAVTKYFAKEGKPEILIGRDTRLSGKMLESALAAGICSAGGDACLVGVMPTPAIAYLTSKKQATVGVVISASHNPFMDNGIKFFSSTGHKLPDTVEDAIEEIINNDCDYANRPIGEQVGIIDVDFNLAQEYVEHVVGTLDCDFRGIKVVLDCANGAGYEVAPVILRSLGAEVITIFNEPNGININENCGSTHLENLKRAVLEYKADIGIANDGDADRCLIVDEQGQEVDGDQIMLICALELMKIGKLKDNVLVTTVMSNIGLHRAMKEHGGRCEVTPVGDRYVLEKMLEAGYLLGGEQSGHVIFSDYATTGDGIVTATQVIRSMVKNNQPVSQLAKLMVRYPQILVNAKVKSKQGWQENPTILQEIAKAEQEIGENGRILVRASGTENLIRVMAEGENQEQLDCLAHKIAEVIIAEQRKFDL